MLNDNMLSLEKLCLDVIAYKFERFHFAFSVSQDDNLQRNFEFLKRIFSVQLATALFQKKQMKEKYFEFLMNEHLNFLDCKWLKSSRREKSLEDIFCRLQNLERIRFTSDNGDEILENISNFCPNVTEIDARSSRITDNGLRYLCERKNGTVPSPQLKKIFIVPSCVTSKGVECLIRNLPSLERTDYVNVPPLLHSIYKESLSKFEKLHYCNLIELDFSECYGSAIYTDILKTCFSVCPKLESVYCVIAKKDELDLLTNYPLKKLKIYFLADFPKINVDNFLRKNGRNLSTLCITKCSVSISLLAIHCPILKEFYADRVNFTHDVHLKPKFRSLIKCSLSNTDPSDDESICLLFSSSPVLETLSLTCCTLSLQMKAHILGWCKNSSAKIVDFWFLKLEMEFLNDMLKSCSSLKKMFLIDCSVDVQDPKEVLLSTAKILPNKPEIYFG